MPGFAPECAARPDDRAKSRRISTAWNPIRLAREHLLNRELAEDLRELVSQPVVDHPSNRGTNG